MFQIHEYQENPQKEGWCGLDTSREKNDATIKAVI